MAKIRAVLLDCDNTLIQSERLAFEACCELTNVVLEAKGINHRYTPKTLLQEFVGLDTAEMFRRLEQRHGFDLSDDELNFYVNAETDAVADKLRAKVIECPGATSVLAWLRDQQYPLAVVSTSAISRVLAGLERSKLKQFFGNRIYSATSTLDPPSGKPDPKIYNYACEQLSVKQSECVAVEDSRSGATAALRAGIPCIAYVGIYSLDESKQKEDEMAEILTRECRCIAVMRDWKEFPDILSRLETGSVASPSVPVPQPIRAN